MYKLISLTGHDLWMLVMGYDLGGCSFTRHIVLRHTFCYDPHTFTTHTITTRTLLRPALFYYTHSFTAHTLFRHTLIHNTLSYNIHSLTIYTRSQYTLFYNVLSLHSPSFPLPDTKPPAVKIPIIHLFSILHPTSLKIQFWVQPYLSHTSTGQYVPP